MSLAQNETFCSTLEAELRGVGLPITPHEVVGRLYRFGCEHGSHHHILSGTIQAIEISDEGGFDLYVTNPRFWGRRLISIKYNNGAWMAYVDIEPLKRTDKELEQMSEEEFEQCIAEENASRFFEGEFEIL